MTNKKCHIAVGTCDRRIAELEAEVERLKTDPHYKYEAALDNCIGYLKGKLQSVKISVGAAMALEEVLNYAMSKRNDAQQGRSDPPKPVVWVRPNGCSNNHIRCTEEGEDLPSHPGTLREIRNWFDGIAEVRVWEEPKPAVCPMCHRELEGNDGEPESPLSAIR